MSVSDQANVKVQNTLWMVFRFVAVRSAEFALSYTLKDKIPNHPRGSDEAEYLNRLEVGQQFQLVEKLIEATYEMEDEAFLAFLRTSKLDALGLSSEDSKSWFSKEANTLGEMLLTILREFESLLSWEAEFRKNEIKEGMNEEILHPLEKAHCDMLLSQIGFLRLAIIFIEVDILGK